MYKHSDISVFSRISRQPVVGHNPIVFVIDDDRSLLNSICAFFHSHDISTRGYQSGEDFLAAFIEPAQGCILCDYVLPGIDGLEVQKALLQKGVTTPFIFLSGNANVQMTVAAWKDGAVTLIEKPFRVNDLLTAVKAAFRCCQKTLTRKEAMRRFQKVQPTELTVLRYLVAGFINKQIARRMNVSERTVERRKNRLLEATNTNSILETIELARKAEMDLQLNPQT